MIKRIKSTLRRKFELVKVSADNQNIKLYFKLKNFIKLDANNFFIEINNEKKHCKVKKKSNNYIEIDVNSEHILNKDLSFSFFYKNKKLWTTSEKNLNHILEVNNNIYILKVDKSLLLSKYKTNFNFIDYEKEIKIQQLKDNYIDLGTKEKIKSLILMNESNQIEVSINNNKMNLDNIKDVVKKGSYKIYVVSNQAIYPAQIEKTKETNYLIMKYEWKNKYLYVSINDITVPQFNITSVMNEPFLRMSTFIENTNLNDDYQFKSLGLIDSDLNNVKYLTTKRYKSQINSELKLSEFHNDKNKKIIAIFQDKKSNNEIFFCLNSEEKVKFTGSYYFENQILNLNFKNKKEITIVNSKPKIKMGVNSISEKELNIYFLPNSIYKTFQYYITFEERTSQNRYEIEISEGEQCINIPYEEIESLKTTSKNIVDIFISIYDGSDIIRKEKLKFKKGIYKKDNYITLEEKLLDNKKVFYMFTLTPFKNIKIETFELTLENYEILEKGRKSNDTWLIGERTDTAQDNGIQFFKWLQKYTNINAYYVIDEDSNDYDNVSNLNNIITFGSKKHFEVSSKANVLISTHDLENILPYKTAKNFWGYENSVRIFLQHGVLGRKKVEYDKNNYELPFHLFNVSSTNEKYDIVVNQLGYEPKEVAVTGLPRFDSLPLKPKSKTKKILIMPTWRDWLNSDYAFENSEYMNRYINLINHPKFVQLIQDYNIEVNFYPHYRSQSFFKQHLDKTESLINYVSLGEQTVQDLLIEHDVLITDYSSVSFDFSYMKKPVIFFHFDVERFFKKGIFRPIEETFIGDIVYDEKEVLDKVEKILSSSQHTPIPNLNHVFDFIDHKNNERVYYEILNKIKENS
ncbi:CDP-glycerol glycerophosphotransferase family protein [Staphylococcus nepalensis]|uniref:CDP-glycerol glycerophosphotransferase family protein n=1 Tax=Staphylococcus nepalensis TaxID=214473 RepID=UPI0024B791D2|nr:CDP-glycerol glycerophosphotransferase family protein [Staphylococcus nepalensis]MDR5650338.1 CDP-glycerol glycerophosphotransferase family protein [Staphylococcus nepalensis]